MAIRTHLFAAEGQDPQPAVWTYARRPALCHPDPPSTVCFYWRDLGGEHPEQYLAGFARSM